ncbi:cyclic lactone autoinducer peptide [Eisenbergiella tayi]|uniref:Cyclic lactone autoinducer peptide n=1 Tax=Eisenbergiella porci TaxID=2652274 RepID=A0A6N7W8D5_9FIRM|nr:MULTISPECIES: cyclic lactone autoinducer peptide [Eisenbergiella]MSS86913.1 cyclic lactone autoinducer peptide [Eisenbergiella porci]
MRKLIRYYILQGLLLVVYMIGITTVSATSRYTGYQPEESKELLDTVRQLRKRS